MKPNVKLLKAEAQILRYCGFNARADYQLMHIVVRAEMTPSEWTKLQDLNESCIMVPPKFLKGN